MASCRGFASFVLVRLAQYNAGLLLQSYHTANASLPRNSGQSGEFNVPAVSLQRYTYGNLALIF